MKLFLSSIVFCDKALTIDVMRKAEIMLKLLMVRSSMSMRLHTRAELTI